MWIRNNFFLFAAAAVALFSADRAVAQDTAKSLMSLPDFEAYSGADGGFISRIVVAALDRGAPETPAEVALAEGPEPHKAALDADDLVSFPWYRPSCEEPAFLNEHTKRLCAEFEWSESLYEMFIGFYSREDRGRVLSSTRDVYGSTICVSGTEFPNMLREFGITPYNSLIQKAASPRECLDNVLSGEADYAFLPDDAAGRLVQGDEAYAALERQPRVDGMITLHAVAPKGAADAVRTLEALDRGVAEIRADGSWFNIIAAALYAAE